VDLFQSKKKKTNKKNPTVLGAKLDTHHVCHISIIRGEFVEAKIVHYEECKTRTS